MDVYTYPHIVIELYKCEKIFLFKAKVLKNMHNPKKKYQVLIISRNGKKTIVKLIFFLFKQDNKVLNFYAFLLLLLLLL